MRTALWQDMKFCVLKKYKLDSFKIANLITGDVLQYTYHSIFKNFVGISLSP